jgi:hypothetical protein
MVGQMVGQVARRPARLAARAAAPSLIMVPAGWWRARSDAPYRGVDGDGVVVNDGPEIAGGGVVAELDGTAGIEVGIGPEHAEAGDEIGRPPGEPCGKSTGVPRQRTERWRVEQETEETSPGCRERAGKISGAAGSPVLR